MAEMLLINPRKRRRNPAKRAVKARRKNPIARAHAPKRRRRNPIAAVRARVVGRGHARRRRNPISLGVSRAHFMDSIKQALMGASGALAVDAIMGQLNPHLPASLQINDNTTGVGDAVKAALTVVLGKVLSKSTRGMSQKMALGALTVQAHGLMSSYMPASMKMAGVGYMSPARVTQGTNRVGPVRMGVNAYTGGRPPLLNAFTSGSQVLGRNNQSAREREGFAFR